MFITTPSSDTSSALETITVSTIVPDGSVDEDIALGSIPSPFIIPLTDKLAFGISEVVLASYVVYR